MSITNIRGEKGQIVKPMTCGPAMVDIWGGEPSIPELIQLEPPDLINKAFDITSGIHTTPTTSTKNTIKPQTKGRR